MVKTGECFFRDEDGSLWLAESFADADGNVTTQHTEIDRADGAPVAPAITML